MDKVRLPGHFVNCPNVSGKVRNVLFCTVGNSQIRGQTEIKNVIITIICLIVTICIIKNDIVYYIIF